MPLFSGLYTGITNPVQSATFKRSEPLFADEKSDEPSHEVEAALARLQQDPVEKLNAEDYRRRLLAAIDTLPDQERRVINLLLKDIPIDSKDPNATTIVGILNCSEKTVRNRRDRAYNMLRPFLGLPVSND